MQTSLSLTEAYEHGRATWPAVKLDLVTFERRMQQLRPESRDLAARAGDLYLATACLAGDPAAVLAFEQTFVTPVPAQLTRASLSPQLRDELRQQLRIKLLVGPAAQIAEYRGIGPLGGWVRICALRLALDLKIGTIADRASEDVAALDSLMAADASSESRIDVHKHRTAFLSALHGALATLTPRQRTLLRLHFVDGTSIQALAVLYRVHRATVSRWLLAIRNQVIRHVRDEIGLALGASPSEARSLVRELHSNVGVSVQNLLDEETPR
jgi:RNA polymerase sigma-70 factor, ECF subfamily